MSLPTESQDPAPASPTAGAPLWWTIDRHGRYTSADSATAEFLGPAAGSLPGSSWLDAVHPEDRAACHAAFAAAVESHQPFRIEYRLRRHDGVYRHVFAGAAPCTLFDSAHGGFIAFCFDLTTWQESAARLRELSLATEHSPVTVLVADASGRIQYVNPKFTALTGYTPEEVIGQNPRILKSGEMPPEEYSAMWAQLLSGREWRGEFHNKRKDGTLFWESALISPVRDPSGAITQFVAVKEDITERKRLAAEVAEAQLRAQAAERAKSEFLHKMSHEFRTPMNGILGMAYLLEDSPLGPEHRNYLQVLTESAQSLLDFLTQVLELVHLSEGTHSLQTAPFSLSECLAQCLGLFSAAACKKGIELRSSIAPSVPATLHGDRFRLAQILASLIGNAVKFSPSGAVTVSVDSEPEPDPSDSARLRFSVADQGPGIAPETLARIFEPFEQGDNSHTRQHTGAGLGLAISRNLVQAMGGRLEAVSRPGHGSTFFFTAAFPHPPES